MIGKPTHVAGWKLHVSATVAGVDPLFERVLPCLARHGADFKMAAERETIVQLCAGAFGEAQIGKVITVYARDDNQAAAVAGELIEHTRGIEGPAIATDLHLGEAVYARYGSVSPRIVHDRFGEPTELIPDGRGNWVPDLRSVPFNCPSGITIPFRTATFALASPQPHARRLLGGRYFVTDVLFPGVGGSVLRAIDLNEVGVPAAYVLKQARAHYATDELGRDRRARLRHEAVVLARLRGVTGIAAAADYFEDQGTGYLPIAYVPGQTLAEFVYRRVSGRPWGRLRLQVRRRLLQYAAQLVHRLRSAHARGIIHRDIAPGNVWVGDDERVYLIDWECAHIINSRTASFRLGTPGFSDLSHEQRAPTCRDDWQSCGRVLAFMLTGMQPAALVHGPPRELAQRLAALTELRDTALIELLARALANPPRGELTPASLLGALASLRRGQTSRRRQCAAPLFIATAHEAVLTEGCERLAACLRTRLDRLRSRKGREAALIDSHAGIAGLLYVLAGAHRAPLAHLHASLGARAVQALIARTPAVPDLPGLVHGRAGRALAVAAAVQAGCSSAKVAPRVLLGRAAGRVDWPDFTHGAAGQGFAALACARRLAEPALAGEAAACADYLVRTQNPDGGWTLPPGVPGASGECFTGFAHGAAGMMGFLGTYAAFARDPAADAAWRRAESWLVSRARRGRAGRWYWPRSDTQAAPSHWWCHGSCGIALGWLCVARAQGLTAVAEEYLRGALSALPPTLRSDSLGQCHGLAGVGEVYLEAYRVLGEERWRERAADLAKVLVGLFRRHSLQPWHVSAHEAADGADGLMLGAAGIVHFLLRYHYPAVVTSAPLLA